MKVLVTGSDGYIGAVLTPLLVKRGHEVRGLDTGFYVARALYGVDDPHVPTLRMDVRRVRAADLEGLDAVVHLAELSNDPLGELNPELTHRINHGGTVQLARRCIEAGVTRFVYTSSCSVYGAGRDGFVTEASPVDPQTAYARCKVLVEQDLSRMADDAFSPTFLRNATAFGPSPRMRFDLVLNNLAGWARTTGEIRLTSDGTPWRPLVHVGDIAEAIARTLEAPREVVHNQVFNVGDTRQNYRVREIAEIVAGVFPGCRLNVGRSDGDNRSYRVAFDRIGEILPGFECAWRAEQGAQDLADVFERIHLSQEDFQSAAFTRLKQLKQLLAEDQLDADLFWRVGAAAVRPASGDS